ncbi:MAG: ribose 5-phosphate isomerase B [Acidobacteria bacterium]|nr:ribose 5-phosphate isomerase B [Acidobacteriota bacterium]
MKIALGADHAGFQLKEHLRQHLLQQGHHVVDVGTSSEESTDYPDYAAQVAQQVAQGEAECGLLVCSTGVGMSIAANKVDGIRAALAVNEDEVRLTRAHNNANILAIGARFTSPEEADKYADVFLSTAFEGGRHQRRLDKVSQLEQQ